MKKVLKKGECRLNLNIIALFCILCTFIPFPFSKTAGNICCKAAGSTTTYAHPVEQQDVQQQYIQLLAA
jgi:hypothetical protein